MEFSEGGMTGYGFLIALLEVGKQDVADAEAGTADFILVCGADAFQGGADFAAAASLFVDPVKGTVRGQDQLGLAGDVQILLPVHAPVSEFL